MYDCLIFELPVLHPQFIFVAVTWEYMRCGATFNRLRSYLTYINHILLLIYYLYILLTYLYKSYTILLLKIEHTIYIETFLRVEWDIKIIAV